MKTLRFDTAVIGATRSDDGFLYDTPTITRAGVFPYRNPDGGTRYELRPPDEVFKAESLASLKGVPITNGHHGKLNSKTAKPHIIGAVLGNARQDGDNLSADIVIYDPSAVDAGNKELSCGYECDLEMKGGEWQGRRYDCIQRNIRYNHLAVVGKGRAGNARLNLDEADAASFFEPETKENTMVKLRLDNGIEYDAAPEVAAAFDKMRQDLDDAQKAKDKAKAQRDTLAADLKELQDGQPEILKKAVEDAKKRLELEARAKENGVDVKDGATDRDIQIAVIKKIRPNGLDLTNKSNDYIQAAFDFALADNTQTDAAKQRQDMADATAQTDVNRSLSASQARLKMMRGE